MIHLGNVIDFMMNLDKWGSSHCMSTPGGVLEF